MITHKDLLNPRWIATPDLCLWMHDPKWLGQLAWLSGMWMQRFERPYCVRAYATNPPEEKP